MPKTQLFMTKDYDVILNCFIFAAVLFTFHFRVTSLVIHCMDEAMKAETRIQLIKSSYVTVVFLAQ